MGAREKEKLRKKKDPTTTGKGCQTSFCHFLLLIHENEVVKDFLVFVYFRTKGRTMSGVRRDPINFLGVKKEASWVKVWAIFFKSARSYRKIESQP